MPEDLVPALERRSFLSEFRLSEDRHKPTLSGHAAVFGQKSEEIFGFREMIRPGAFSKTIKKDDIRALWNHDPNYVLGRRKAGTLDLEEDATGLAVRIHTPDTVFASDLLQTIKRGDVDQMSFGFRTITDDWRHLDGDIIRELIEVELFDVSPVTFPAYPQTDIAARTFFEARMKSLGPGDLLQAGGASREGGPSPAKPSIIEIVDPERILAIRNKLSAMRQKLIEKVF